MNSIIWKGVSSTTIKGLIISELPPISKPEMRVSETIIDGVNGSQIEDLGYNSYDKPLVIGLYGAYDINEVIKYFSGEGDVVFSNEPDKVYRAKIYAQIDYNRLLRYRQATVLFRTQPFKYAFNEEIIATETAIASGTSIVVNDSENANLKEFKIYGKSTQDGIPTPDAPIDIVSVGADGSVGVTINGLNLFDLTSGYIRGVSKEVTFIDNGFVLDASVKETRIYTFKCCLIKGKTYYLSCDTTNVSGTGNVYASLPKLSQYFGVNKSFTPTEDTDELSFYIQNEDVPTVLNITNVQVSLTTKKEEYEEFKEQSATITLIDSLKGIQVTDESLATYTDAEGKKWCADEIDLERGVLIQRVCENTLTFGSSGNTNDGAYLYSAYLYGTQNVMNTRTVSTHFKWVTSGALASLSVGEMIVRDRTDFPVVYCVSTIANVDDFNAWFSANGVRLLSILATPTETPLTEEQIAIGKSLKANYPTTTIINDENAHMSVEYLKPFEVENKGLETSRPIMTITGTGTVEISVNGVGVFTYTFPEGESQVVIDSEKEDAYHDDTLKNRNMNGEFPILQPGVNKIEWSGDVESIEIKPRSRWL